MKEHDHFLIEKDQIDGLLNDGFSIGGVSENLEGTFVRFQKEAETFTLHLESPDARKYFAFLLKQRAASASSESLS